VETSLEHADERDLIETFVERSCWHCRAVSHRQSDRRWPFLPVILTSGHPREGQLPLGVDFMPKPWQPLNLLVAAKQALACV